MEDTVKQRTDREKIDTNTGTEIEGQEKGHIETGIETEMGGETGVETGQETETEAGKERVEDTGKGRAGSKNTKSAQGKHIDTYVKPKFPDF